MESNIDILKIGEKILISEARVVDNFDRGYLQPIIDKLFAAMHRAKGIGIAGPQVNLPYKIFVYGFTHSERYPEFEPVADNLMINAEILEYSNELITLEEGCLSIPFLRGMVPRSKTINVKYFDIDGNMHVKDFHDFEARIIQHECDHTNGLFFLNRMNELASLRNVSC